MNRDQIIYHMCRSDEWQSATERAQYYGSSQDIADGFIHFSTAAQIKESAARHRAGQDNLVLLWVDPTLIRGATLKWEKSRGGQLFPHLYGPLTRESVIRTDALNLGAAGLHVFPSDFPGSNPDDNS